jgi:hypothetical protein
MKEALNTINQPTNQLIAVYSDEILYQIQIQTCLEKYASEILPLIFQYLGRATNEIDKNPKGLVKSYYALEMFCENLGKKRIYTCYTTAL